MNLIVGLDPVVRLQYGADACGFACVETDSNFHALVCVWWNVPRRVSYEEALLTVSSTSFIAMLFAV